MKNRATLTILITCFVVFILQKLLNIDFAFTFKDWFYLIPSNFSHANFQHLAGNAVFLILLGPQVEAKLGFVKTLLFFTIAGSLSAILSIAYGPIGGTLGASLGLSAFLGLYPYLFFNKSSITLFSAVVLMNILDNYFSSLTSVLFGNIVINHTGHLYGTILGLLFAVYHSSSSNSSTTSQFKGIP